MPKKVNVFGTGMMIPVIWMGAQQWLDHAVCSYMQC